MYDFAVVGAGPAGSRFARRAAEAGHDVVCFERGAVGRPLACSGHVSTDLWAFTPEGARDRLLQNEIRGARFHVGGPGSPEYPFYKDETVSNVIDRVGLDELLAEAAREAGAAVCEHHTVVGLEEREGHVEVRVRAGGGTETRRARMVVGCDGPTSRVRRELGLPEPGELLQGVLGFSDEPEARGASERAGARSPRDGAGEYVDVHLTPPRFFAWRIPRGEAGVEYGLAAPPDARPSARERFDAFTDEYGVSIRERCAGLIPVGPPAQVTGRRSFLVGDAAAQTKPFTGGGIVYGMTAADHAARTVDPADPATLEDYERAWRADLGTEIRLGHLVRRAYSLPPPVQRAGLRALSGRIGVHMDKPTTLFSREHLRALLSRS